MKNSLTKFCKICHHVLFDCGERYICSNIYCEEIMEKKNETEEQRKIINQDTENEQAALEY